jgi:hypothetical protein
VKEYPEAGHSFLNNHESSFFKMLQIIHIGYDEPAAEGCAKKVRQIFSRAFGQLGDITPLLHIHDHERHIVALRLAIRERRYFIEDASDDLL